MQRPRKNDSNGASKTRVTKNRKYRENEKKITGRKRLIKRSEIFKKGKNGRQGKIRVERKKERMGGLASRLVEIAFKKYPYYAVIKPSHCKNWDECVIRGRVLYGLYFMIGEDMHQIFIRKEDFHKQKENKNV